MMPVMTDTDEVCNVCGRPIPLGSPYSERLLAVDDDTFVVEVVCPVGFCRGES